MRFRWPPIRLTSRILVFVSTSTLASTLVLSGVASDAEHTAVREQLEHGQPTRLREHEHELRQWMAQRGTGLEAALVDPGARRLLSEGLAAVAAEGATSLEIIGPRGRSVAGELDPAPHAEALAAALPSLATPSTVAGPGATVYATARPIGRTPFHLVSSLSLDRAFEPARRFQRRIFLASLCLAGLFTLLAHLITRRILAPLHTLSTAAQRISRGEIDLDIDLATARVQRDEIGVLTRTFDSMLARLRTNQHEIEHNNAHLRERNLELQHANQILEQLSITDGLTKLHNHRYFQELLAHESKRVDRTGTTMALMLIDLDDFKRLNDCYGHAAGDQVLSAIARRLNSSIRETDLLARYGGEEFVVLSTGTNLIGAWVLAEKIRLAIEQADFVIDDCLSPLPVTVSIGVAEYAGCCKRLFREADAALYRAKAQGKNCVLQASPAELAS